MRYGNILRFPRAAGELPCAIALRDLTDAFTPAGIYVYFLRPQVVHCSSLGFNSYVPVYFHAIYYQTMYLLNSLA